MKFTRRSRVVAALLALVSMLFMQLATAAYACPAMQIVPVLDAAHTVPGMAADHEAMADCEGMMENADQPALCYGTSQLGAQSLAQSAPELPPAIPVLLVPVVGDVVGDTLSTLRLISSIAQSDQMLRDTSPPLSIRNCCFRI